jgi:hypothetical protein
MNRHLRDTELVDLVDGTLPPVRRQHLAECAECRGKGEMLSAAMQRASESGVPEPSPLFWDQFSARVHETIANEPEPRTAMRAIVDPAHWNMWAAGAATAAVLILAAVLWRGAAPDPRGAASGADVAAVASVIPADAAVEDPLDLEADEGWALVRGAAEDLGPDEMHEAGVTAGPGSADGATTRLSDRERIELARLLEAEIKTRRAESSS